MANARVIRRNFFNDPLIAGQYKIEQRYLLLGLACASDDYGRFWWNPSNLKSIIYPVDNKQPKWIEKNLICFCEDGIICKYEVNNIQYGHFPFWFDKSFCLKQRLDHPKPEQLPDCEHHRMNEKNTRIQQESSPPIKPKVMKPNKTEITLTKPNVNATDDSKDLFKKIIKYYPKEKIRDENECFQYWNTLKTKEQILINRCADIKTTHWRSSPEGDKYAPYLINYLTGKYKDEETLSAIRNEDYMKRQ